jgi:transposase
MNATTKSRFRQVLVWLAWLLVILATLRGAVIAPAAGEPLVAAAACPAGPDPFPWRPRFHWHKWALIRYQAWKRRFRQARAAYHRMVWTARLARLTLAGALPMAALVDWLTRAQLRRNLGALPVLYAFLDILQVRQVINRHCPSGRADVDHGTVALVLVLNRLTAPRPLYRVADWLAQTALTAALGVPAARFNDDRLGRTLEVLAAHAETIWQEVVHQALLRFDLDVRFLFYDLVAFVVHGEYEKSALADFGFAHNTPMGKRKIKLGVTASGDGNVPLDYRPWSGRTADTATVQENLERLRRLLERHGYPTELVLLTGDRANLNDALALAYDAHGIHYLAGLEPRRREHRALLVADEESAFQPLGEEGYLGRSCPVVFKHQGQTAVHRGLVVISRPMQQALRDTRSGHFQALETDLTKVRQQIGQRGHRTAAQVQRRAATCCRRSPVGHLVQIQATEENGQITLRWTVDQEKLQAEERRDGRYLLVTNDPTLTPAQMLARYRQKDGLEKRFRVCKQELRVSPIYLHKDERITGMLLLHMLALLTYSLLERQVRRHSLSLTTRRIITALEDLTVIETHCWDGSVLVRLTPVSADQAQLLAVLAEVIAEVRWPQPRPALVVGPALLSLPGQGQDLSPGGTPLVRLLLAG